MTGSDNEGYAAVPGPAPGPASVEPPSSPRRDTTVESEAGQSGEDDQAAHQEYTYYKENLTQAELAERAYRATDVLDLHTVLPASLVTLAQEISEQCKVRLRC
mgnify:CR=1 FL=1